MCVSVSVSVCLCLSVSRCVRWRPMRSWLWPCPEVYSWTHTHSVPVGTLYTVLVATVPRVPPRAVQRTPYLHKVNTHTHKHTNTLRKYAKACMTCGTISFCVNMSSILTDVVSIPGTCLVKIEYRYTKCPKVCGHLLVEQSHSKNMGINMELVPPFAAITASTLQGRLSTRCWNIAAGTCFHSATRALVWPGTNVGRLGLAGSRRSNSSKRCLMGLRSGLCAVQSSSSTPISTNHFCMDRCMDLAIWQLCCHKVGNTESSRMSLYAVALRFPEL